MTVGWGIDSLNLTRVCPICGKKFIPEVQHVYRDKSDPNRPPVCTYHCMRESERRADAKREETVRRYKRLNPAEMTEKQRRDRINRCSVKCEECDYSRIKQVDGEIMLFCEHSEREYIYQNKTAHRGRNMTGLIMVIREGEEEKRIRTPRWCPLKKGDDAQ